RFRPQSCRFPTEDSQRPIETLERAIDVLSSVSGRDRALLGRNGNEENALLEQRTPNRDVACKVVVLDDVVKVTRRLRHEVEGKRRSLPGDACRYAVAGEYAFHAVLDLLAERLEMGVDLRLVLEEVADRAG